MKLRKPGTFENGNQAHLGKEGAGGRPPDWLKEMCKKIVEEKKIVEFLGDVASGAPVRMALAVGDEKPVEGTKVSADIKDRIKATEILLDRGFGKAPQDVNLNGEISFDLVSALLKERGSRGVDAKQA